MIELSPVRRAASRDEGGNVGALLMGQDGAFITGSDFLMDGGVTASYWSANSRRSEREAVAGQKLNKEHDDEKAHTR
jgi:hypothetical protein